MMNKSQIQIKLREAIPQLTEEYQISALGVFGSYVRDEQTAGSDLDLLVSFSTKPSLFKFIELENHLSNLLCVKVDLVMESALKPRIGEHILKERVML